MSSPQDVGHGSGRRGGKEAFPVTIVAVTEPREQRTRTLKTTPDAILVDITDSDARLATDFPTSVGEILTLSVPGLLGTPLAAEVLWCRLDDAGFSSGLRPTGVPWPQTVLSPARLDVDRTSSSSDAAAIGRSLEMLGATIDSSLEEVETAYRRLAKRIEADADVVETEQRVERLRVAYAEVKDFIQERSKPTEQRTSRRYPVDEVCFCMTDGSQGADRGRLFDVSRTGARVLCDFPVTVGQMIGFRITGIDMEPVSGKVMRAEPAEALQWIIGVRLVQGAWPLAIFAALAVVESDERNPENETLSPERTDAP